MISLDAAAAAAAAAAATELLPSLNPS